MSGYNSVNKYRKGGNHMNYPCTRNLKLRRLLTLAAALVLLSSLLAGCFNSGKDKDPTDNSSNLPNLIEDTSAPSTETEPPTTDPDIPENTAIVKEQVNVRGQPSATSPVIAQLDAGTQCQVLMLKKVHGIEWAYLSQGWVPTENLDMSHVTLTSDSTDTPAASDPENTAEGTTAPTQAETTGSQTSTTAGTTYGVVTGSELNIRKEPNANSTRVGSYAYGTRLTFTETSNGWGKTNKGWVSLQYVYVDGDNGSNGCTGTVTGNGLNVRTGPGTNYDKAKTLSKGDKVTVKERIKVGSTYWGYVTGGWICMDYVDVDGESNTTNNNNSTATTGNGTVTGNGLNIRSGAGTDYDMVGSLKKGDRVTIQETQTVDGVKWGRITQGWICLTYVKMD